MATSEDSSSTVQSAAPAAAFPWILEHILAFPGSYELPLRTMYTLNCASLNQQSQPVRSNQVSGNAFPRSAAAATDEPQHAFTASAAAQLRANLMTHISQMSAQPTSLPPSFITSFVRKCFPKELGHVDFPQALTAMDYLKDLEVRRRSEILAVIRKLGIDSVDLANRDLLNKKNPTALAWLDKVEEREKRLEAVYSQVYVGLRRWTMINEMSLLPFNKSNCIAMLNTLYPPLGMTSSQIAQPTTHLTPAILSEQRNAYFRYIMAVEKKGAGILNSLMRQHKRAGDETGWPCLRDSLDHYLTVANAVIDECHDTIASVMTPITTSFPPLETEEDTSRKLDSAISFSSSGRSSNRSSGQSHVTRPSTSSSFSTHSRHASKDKPLPSPVLDSNPPSPKTGGSTLELLARGFRRMRSRSSVRESSQARPPTAHSVHAEPTTTEGDQPPPVPAKGLSLRRSLKKMRSNSALRERDANITRPSSRAADDQHSKDTPAFDAEQMRLQRQAWEASQK